MKTRFHILGLNSDATLHRWLEQSLQRLRGLISVATAAVVVERRREEKPPFRAFVSLAVPGPDIHAEAREHTLEAVWLKVTTALRQQIERRKGNQEIRRRSRRPRLLTGSRGSGGLVGGRA